ncbi:hypothetical protein SAMN04488117_101724 [Celeribacter baekdonensis]|uniref:Uncharacterized protein n=1 Tax=Celeribacter baekdonensis TaxID=875171 RepID=A0A1G7GV17_9RHOB|nr:hypothetical protein SAMN04488117_101724 [Celeribacter baekdonensis]
MGQGPKAPIPHPTLFHPDYTVGPGVTPDLLSQGASVKVPVALAGLHQRLRVVAYRRWGISPRPERFCGPNDRDA